MTASVLERPTGAWGDPPAPPVGFSLVASGLVSDATRTDAALSPIPGEIREDYLDTAGFGYQRWVAPCGLVTYEWWRNQGGFSHREGGRPATTRLFPDGSVRSEAFYVDGRRSRLNGPALTLRHADGSIEDATWYIGSRIANPTRLEASFIELPGTELRREVECSVFRVLLSEGISVEEVLAAVTAGIRTPEGVRCFLDGAPAAWVIAFESADA